MAPNGGESRLFPASVLVKGKPRASKDLMVFVPWSSTLLEFAEATFLEHWNLTGPKDEEGRALPVPDGEFNRFCESLVSVCCGGREMLSHLHNPDSILLQLQSFCNVKKRL